MRDEVQQLRDFSLEGEFGFGGISHGKRNIEAKNYMPGTASMR